jgi:hypothetical protein
MRFRPRLAEPKSLRDGSKELFSKRFCGVSVCTMTVYLAPLASPIGAFESSQVIYCLGMGP